MPIERVEKHMRVWIGLSQFFLFRKLSFMLPFFKWYLS